MEFFFFFEGWLLRIFVSVKHLFSNIFALIEAFFKEPTWLNFQVGFIIDPFRTQNMNIQNWKVNCHICTHWQTHQSPRMKSGHTQNSHLLGPSYCHLRNDWVEAARSEYLENQFCLIRQSCTCVKQNQICINNFRCVLGRGTSLFGHN